jgi:predicted RND superfamily exporter protein
MQFPYERLVGAVERRHRAILLASALLLVVSAWSLFRLRFDIDLLSQLPSGSPTFRAYRTYLEAFGGHDQLIVLIQGERSRIVDFADAFADRLRGVPGVASVRHRVVLEDVKRSVLDPYRFQLLTEEDYRALADRLEVAAIDARVASMRTALSMPMALGASRWMSRDPFGVTEILGRSIERRYTSAIARPAGEVLLSSSGEALLMLVRPAGSPFDTVSTERLMASVRDAETGLLSGAFADSGIRVGYTGSYVYALADRTTMRRDLSVYFVMAPLAVLAVFYVGFRSLRILLLVGYPLLLITITTFALSLVAFDQLNMVSVAFAGIFYGMGIDAAIYFYAALRRRAPAEDLSRSIAETLRELGRAIVVASTTTAAAFFVIGLSDFAGIRQLGIFTGVAMLLNVASTFVLLPALCFRWPATVDRGHRAEEGVESRTTSALAARPRLVAAVTAALLIAALVGIRRVHLDTDFRNLRPGQGDAENVEKAIAAAFGRSESAGTVLSEAAALDTALADAEEVASRLEEYRRQGLVGSYATITAFLPSAATAFARRERFESLPREPAVAAFRAAVERHGFAADAFEPALRDFVRGDAGPIGFTREVRRALDPLAERHLDVGGDRVLVATDVTPAAGRRLATVRQRLATDLPSTSATVLGAEVVQAEFRRLLEGELVLFLAAAIALNLAILAASERSLVSAIVLLSPTLVALVLYLGLAGFTGMAIDPVNLIVLPLLVGLGVDDVVYLRAHVRHEQSLSRGVARGGPPLVVVVLTTMVGYGSLALSTYPALRRLGIAAAAALGLAAVTSFLLLPLVLRLTDRRQPNR